MKAFNTKQLIREIAKEYGKTPAEIRSGIEEVIDDCWSNPDPEVHALWSSMSPTGTRPTVEQCILYLSAMVATEQLMMEEGLLGTHH